jgi:hypothetical protein
MNEHHYWDVRPERSEEGDGVDFVDHEVEMRGELASIAAKCGPVDGPLSPSANNMDSVNCFLALRAREAGAKPLNGVAPFD